MLTRPAKSADELRHDYGRIHQEIHRARKYLYDWNRTGQHPTVVEVTVGSHHLMRQYLPPNMPELTTLDEHILALSEALRRVREVFVAGEVARLEAARKEKVEKAALKKEMFEKEALEKEALEKQTVEEETLKKAGVKKEPLEEEAFEKEALDEAALEKEALEEEELEKKALEKEVSEKEALKKVSTNPNSSGRRYAKGNADNRGES